MAITNAEIAARLADMFSVNANDELVRKYPRTDYGFVDGNFDSWQVGTSFTLPAATDQYTADMWRAISGTGGACTVSRLAVGAELPPAWVTSGRRYKLRFAQTTAASSAPQLYQNIEGVGNFSGRIVTVSASLVAAAAANLVTAIQVVQNFGSGGSPSSAVVTVKNVTWNVGTTEARYSVRVDIPSIAGKTLGTNGDDKLQVAFILATGVTFTLDVSQAQIEECSPAASADTTGVGGTPQPFEYRGLLLETARARQYVNVIAYASGQNIANAGCVDATHLYGWLFTGNKMRRVPSVSLLSGAINSSQAVSGWTNGTTSMVATSDQGLQIANTGSGGTPGSFAWFSANGATAILLDARP